MEKIKTNLMIRVDTNERIEQMMEMTNRGKSDVVDWLVTEKWNEMTLKQTGDGKRVVLIGNNDMTVVDPGWGHGSRPE